MTEEKDSTSSTIQPRVLIADDSKEQHNVLGQFFAAQGWTYDSVKDTPSLLEAVSSRTYDVVVTDLTMPDMEGIPLLNKIKEQRPSQAIIVLADTEFAEEAETVLKSSQALDFLEKPIDLSVLRSIVHRFMSAFSGTYWGSNREPRKQKAVEPYNFERVYTTAEFAQEMSKPEIIDTLYDAGLIDLHTALRIELAYQEAVANALEHGNLELESPWKEDIDEAGRDRYSKLREERLQDPRYSDRKITISITYEDSLLSFTIRDEGNGFLNDQEESHSADDSLKCHGRGLTIMNGIMDLVIYRDHGREVTLEKKVAGTF